MKHTRTDAYRHIIKDVIKSFIFLKKKNKRKQKQKSNKKTINDLYKWYFFFYESSGRVGSISLNIFNNGEF